MSQRSEKSGSRVVRLMKTRPWVRNAAAAAALARVVVMRPIVARARRSRAMAPRRRAAGARLAPMNDDAEVWLVRHGETEWSRVGPAHLDHRPALPPDGERVARGLPDRLDGDRLRAGPDQPAAARAADRRAGRASRRRGRRRPGRVGLRRLRGHHHRGDPATRAGLDGLAAPVPGRGEGRRGLRAARPGGRAVPPPRARCCSSVTGTRCGR